MYDIENDNLLASPGSGVKTEESGKLLYPMGHLSRKVGLQKHKKVLI